MGLKNKISTIFRPRNTSKTPSSAQDEDNSTSTFASTRLDKNGSIIPDLSQPLPPLPFDVNRASTGFSDIFTTSVSLAPTIVPASPKNDYSDSDEVPSPPYSNSSAKTTVPYTPKTSYPDSDGMQSPFKSVRGSPNFKGKGKVAAGRSDMAPVPLTPKTRYPRDDEVPNPFHSLIGTPGCKGKVSVGSKRKASNASSLAPRGSVDRSSTSTGFASPAAPLETSAASFRVRVPGGTASDGALQRKLELMFSMPAGLKWRIRSDPVNRGKDNTPMPLRPEQMRMMESGGIRSEISVFRDTDGMWKQKIEPVFEIKDESLRPPNYHEYGPSEGGWV